MPISDDITVLWLSTHEISRFCRIIISYIPITLEYIVDNSLWHHCLHTFFRALAWMGCVWAHDISSSTARTTRSHIRLDGPGFTVSGRSDNFFKLTVKNLEKNRYSANNEFKKKSKLNILKMKAQKQSQADDDEDEDDDLVATSTNINIIDPISKKMMTEPVRNKHCGHVYDRDSVVQMIATMKRKGFKCPAIGCAHRQPIKESDLEDALDVKREIMRQKKQI
ncbi:unnamed protein product, partial [Meganyctiphanes norvegica]